MPIICDGCGQPASDAHVVRRIRRLELATRFRPIHMQILFLAECPPPRLENYFYFPNEKRESRTGLSRVLFDELMDGLGISPAEGTGDLPFLTEFQKRGCFLADALECPLEDSFPEFRPGKAEFSAEVLAHRYGPTVAKRVALSYKPKQIVPLSARTRHLLPFIEEAGLLDRVLLYEGLPLHFPHPNNPAAQASFREGLASVLKRAEARSAGV